MTKLGSHLKLIIKLNIKLTLICNSVCARASFCASDVEICHNYSHTHCHSNQNLCHQGEFLVFQRYSKFLTSFYLGIHCQQYLQSIIHFYDVLKSNKSNFLHFLLLFKAQVTLSFSLKVLFVRPLLQLKF